ncbi:unnamed protein product, partial [Anisakis simplex]|uniref:Trafficking protein particle complex subunit 8 (inferred by orthology to a human protein) n=1 Tax=Anisakis simplex TaxID=6269 RepID=A0A0M3JGT3_ANISI
MLDDIIRRHFGPLIGVLTSDNVEKIINKNGLNFCDMLIPFSTVQCTVKDPSGSSVTTRLVLDIRDIQRDGFLLSLTVLPSVLHESVSSSCENVQSAFIDSLLQWSEPSEHELLRTYLACVFVVSSDETDPLAELRRLVHMQHT